MTRVRLNKADSRVAESRIALRQPSYGGRASGILRLQGLVGNAATTRLLRSAGTSSAWVSRAPDFTRPGQNTDKMKQSASKLSETDRRKIEDETRAEIVLAFTAF